MSVNGLFMKRCWLRLIFTIGLLDIASARAATNAIPASAVAPAKSSYIVTLRREADQDGCARAFSVQRHHIYRYALNGFAANLDAATVEKLKHDSRVIAVEPDGNVVLDATTVIPAGQLTNQIIPSGILRMGLTNFPISHINGQDNRINVDVAVLDAGVQLDHPDLNVYLPGSASFADGSTNGSDWEGHGTHASREPSALWTTHLAWLGW